MQSETTHASGEERQSSIVGTWHTQVTFSTHHPSVPKHVQGHTENASLLFLPGGVLSAAGPITTTSGGEWWQIDERTYALFLAEFVFEPGPPAGRLSRIVVHKDAVIRLEEDDNSFTMLKACVQISLYDPASGQLTAQQETTYTHDEPNPAERIRGWRISRDWRAPVSVPPQPANG